MAEIKFEIKEHIGVLSESPKGWKTELNMVSWEGREPKYEIRDWSPDYTRYGKATTLTIEELKSLKGILNKMFDNI